MDLEISLGTAMNPELNDFAIMPKRRYIFLLGKYGAQLASYMLTICWSLYKFQCPDSCDLVNVDYKLRIWYTIAIVLYYQVFVWLLICFFEKMCRLYLFQLFISNQIFLVWMPSKFPVMLLIVLVIAYLFGISGIFFHENLSLPSMVVPLTAQSATIFTMIFNLHSMDDLDLSVSSYMGENPCKQTVVQRGQQIANSLIVKQVEMQEVFVAALKHEFAVIKALPMKERMKYWKNHKWTPQSLLDIVRNPQSNQALNLDRPRWDYLGFQFRTFYGYYILKMMSGSGKIESARKGVVYTGNACVALLAISWMLVQFFPFYVPYIPFRG